MLDVTFFGLSDEALEIVPSHTQNFQEWVDSLRKRSLKSTLTYATNLKIQAMKIACY